MAFLSPKRLFTLSFCRYISNQETPVIVNEAGGVRKLIMNSTKTRNALSMDMMVALKAQLENTTNKSLRCVVISSNGPVFSSGHNLKQLAVEQFSDHQATFEECAKLALLISSASVPVIAAVDGVAAAAGCQLAAACDIVVATKKSTFSTPGANFGLFCTGPGITISRSIGQKAALKMLLTGLPISAEEALKFGLITAVCADDKLDETLDLYVNEIKSKSRAVLELGKQFFYKQLQLDLASAYKQGAQLMAKNLTLSDGKEGLKSFVEKRKPIWNHDN